MAGQKLAGNGALGQPEGYVGTFRRVLGMAHDCIFATDYNGGWYSGSEPCPTYGWTRDGLWIGGLLDDPDLSEHPWGVGRYSVGGENLGGNIWEDSSSGHVLYFASGENSGKVYQIKGWRGWERQSGSIDLLAGTTLGVGLRAEYFEDTELRESVSSRIDPQVDFQWGYSVPAGTNILTPQDYSVRWSGAISPVFDELYHFRITTAGGVRLVVDGRTLIHDWQTYAQGAVRQASIPMTPGERYEFQLECQVSGNSGDILLEWTSSNRPWEVLPMEALFPVFGVDQGPAGSGDGIGFELFRGHDFQTQNLLAMGVKPELQVAWGNLPGGLQAGAEYSVRFLGQIEPRQNGSHTFYLEEANLEGDATLWIDHEQIFTTAEIGSLVFPVVNQGAATMQANVPVDFQLDLKFIANPDAQIRLWWSEPNMPHASEGEARHTVPQSQLYSAFSGNAVPSVAIKSPEHGATLSQSDLVVLRAETDDRDGWITRVEYSLNGDILGESVTPPFDFPLGSLTPGVYQFHATAYDDALAYRSSRVVTVLVE